MPNGCDWDDEDETCPFCGEITESHEEIMIREKNAIWMDDAYETREGDARVFFEKDDVTKSSVMLEPRAGWHIESRHCVWLCAEHGDVEDSTGSYNKHEASGRTLELGTHWNQVLEVERAHHFATAEEPLLARHPPEDRDLPF